MDIEMDIESEVKEKTWPSLISASLNEIAKSDL